MTTTKSKVVYSPSFTDGAEFRIPTFKLLKQDGKLYKSAKAPDLEKEKALRIYRAMVTTRILDERMLAAQRQGRLSFYMQCTGEEAAVIGSAAALDDNDMIMAQYREQGALAYRGFSIDEFMNQLFGNELDYGKGRQMPVHYGSKKLNYMTISSPLATQIPQATGYAYDGAEASFELLARRELGLLPRFFDVESYRVTVEKRINARGDAITVSEAVVVCVVDGERLLSVSESRDLASDADHGPVNALSKALAKDLGRYQSYIEDLKLVDFKVRITSGGTEAVTRVLIDSTDAEGRRWSTVGVSPNIVDASFQALLDAITWKLIRDGADAAVLPGRAPAPAAAVPAE